MKQAFLTSRIFDGTAGNYRSDIAILTEGQQIVALVPRSEVPSGYQTLDMGTLTVLPGLIDCHVHLVWNGSHDPNAIMQRESDEKTTVRTLIHAFEELMHGITTVRDVGGPYKAVLAVRDAIREEIFIGPRILAA